MVKNVMLVVESTDFLVKLVSLAKRKGVEIINLNIHNHNYNSFNLELDFYENKKSNFVASLCDLEGVNLKSYYKEKEYSFV